MKANNIQSHETDSQKEVTPKVTGIGGIFFSSEDPKKTKKWYAENLGLEVDQWGGALFEFRNAHRPEEINYLQWSPSRLGSDFFSPSKKEFIILEKKINLKQFFFVL